MRLLLTSLAAAVFLAAGTDWCSAQGTNDNLRRSMGNLRPETSQSTQRRRAQSPVVVVPVYPRGYGYCPRAHGSYYPPRYYGGYYPVYPNAYYGGNYYLPPIVIPAERLYGPQAMRRFMGWP